MKREIALMCCALLFLGVGTFLFVASNSSKAPGAAEAQGERASPSQGRAQEKMMGFFRVVEDLETGEFAVFFPPHRQIARFDPPVQLEIAGLWGLASGAFFAQQPPGPSGEPARCQLFRVGEALTIQTFSWNGHCRLPQVLHSEIFWLDYVPFGARAQVSLPLRLDSGASGKLRVDWEAEGARIRLDEQRAALQGEVGSHCGAEGAEQGCQAALRALAFLAWSEEEGSDGRAALARLVEDLPLAAGAFEEELAEELRQELQEILHQPL